MSVKRHEIAEPELQGLKYFKAISKSLERLQPISHDARLEDLGAILTLVDGTLLKALPKMTWALWQDEKHRSVKAHVQFELLKGVPISAVITEGNGNEKDILSQNLQPGRFYVIDRGYCKFTLFQQMIDIGSSFVGRINDNSIYEIIQEKELSGQAKAAGILWDRGVRLGSKDKKDFLKQPVRILAIQCKPALRTYEMISYYLMGWAGEDELLAHIAKLQKQD